MSMWGNNLVSGEIKEMKSLGRTRSNITIRYDQACSSLRKKHGGDGIMLWKDLKMALERLSISLL